MILTAFIAVAAFAAGPQKRDLTGQMVPVKAQVQLGQKLNLKQASREMLGKVKSSRAHAPKKAVEASALVGDYTWDYLQANEMSTDLESLSTTAGSAHVTITETEAGLTVSGMFPNALEAKVESYEDGDYIVIAAGQTAGTSSYGDYVINGIYYYEGDEQYEAGWYYSDIYGQVLEDGSIYFGDWMCRVLSTGDYAGYNLTPYYVEGSTLTPADPLTPVTVPEGVEILPYILAADNTSATVNVAVDGDDVYFQGMSYYIPEAWVKGTKDGNLVTFPEMQYMGEYGSYGSSYFFYNGETVFTYDEEAKTYSATGQVFGVLADAYYDGNYTNPVLKPVVEKAAMPANPEITALQNGNYGWYFTFNVPAVDVDGDGLLTSKLYYMIYTDIEGEIAPLTFTPATHTKLTEDLTEIPFGFTEGWDIYNDQIYLNELYSADWNNLGIQSIYYGGDETNATEIQWFHIKDYFVPVTGDFTFDFNAMDVATSSNVTSDGDINETVEFTAGNVTLAISPKEEGKNTPNRFWGTNAGPQLRVYSGTLTFTVPKEYLITGIQFNHNGKWGANTVNEIEIPNDTENNVATWTPAEGEELTTEVVVAIAANSQINSIVVTVDEAPEAPEDAIDPDGLTYNFDDGTLQGWTSIDADGDGNDWVLGSEVGGIYLAEGSTLEGYNDSEDCVVSGSYSNVSGALTPDNYLVSPKIKLGSQFKFFACAQDASYPEEHFGVFVSTTGKKVEDFAPVEEWTLKAVRHTPRANGPRKARGTWYEYTIDMSTFEGEEGYVAIRHFDCTDMFLMVVDDITFGTPAFEITPAEGVVESLGEFQIVFNKYEVELAEGAVATLTNTTTEAVQQTSEFTQAGNTLSFLFEETTEPGEYTLTVEGVQTTGGEPVDLSFAYTIEEPLVLVELPEGAEVNNWYLAAYDSEDASVNREVGVAFVDNDIYVQGLCEYLPEAWVKGTVDTEAGTATFATGQFYGTYAEEYDLFFVGYGEDVEDVVFSYDAENGLLTTENFIVLAGDQEANQIYNYYYDVEISRDRPDSFPVEAPEGLETETYNFTAMAQEAQYDEESESYVLGEAEAHSYQIQVGFDGNDVYFSGITSDCADYWMKGTLSEDGKTVTIPASQYMGGFSYWGYTFDYFITAMDEEGGFADVVLNYDAENNTFTTDQTVVLNGSKNDWAPYQAFTNVVITKMPDFAATPADPIFEKCDLSREVGYNKIYASIPTVDVDGNELITSKLFYSIWIEKDGVQQPYTFTADLYANDFEEDVTEVPYAHDGYDIYSGGEIIYLEDEIEEIAKWSKVGIQSIYYGGGERHESNIIWGCSVVAVGENLYATYVAPSDVDFTDNDVEAFTAVVNEETGNVSLLPVTIVPAGTAIVVKAPKAGTFAVVNTTDAVLGAENELVAATEDVVADGTQFVLAKVDDVVGFYQVTTGTTVAAGKGYMTISSAVKAFYPIEGDDATGIFSINAGKNEVIYNLAGQRINKAQKGVNIINGKKILK